MQQQEIGLMKKVAVLILLIIATVVIGGGVYFYFFKNKQATFSWRTSAVEKGDIITLVTATGSLSALRTVQVGTQVSGTIAKLYVDFNSIVKKGQVIAILDTTFLVAARNEAAANVEKATAQLKQYVREFERIKKLFDVRVSTQVEYDVALTNYELGKSNLKSAEAQLTRAKINLRYAIIRAPISGIVISRNVDVGQTVISSFNAPTLFTIANDLTKMEVQANIDEADIGQIRIGQSVTFAVDAYPYEVFEGRIKQIRLQPVTLQNVVNYVVIIDVPNPNLKLMPGLTANIDVKVEERKDVLKVPMSTLQFSPPAVYLASRTIAADEKRKGNKIEKVTPDIRLKHIEPREVAVIWLLESDTLRSEQVVTGISDGTFIEVKGNINEGDIVVTGLNSGLSRTTTAQNPFMPKMPTTRPRPR